MWVFFHFKFFLIKRGKYCDVFLDNLLLKDASCLRIFQSIKANSLIIIEIIGGLSRNKSQYFLLFFKGSVNYSKTSDLSCLGSFAISYIKRPVFETNYIIQHLVQANANGLLQMAINECADCVSKNTLHCDFLLPKIFSRIFI